MASTMKLRAVGRGLRDFILDPALHLIVFGFALALYLLGGEPWRED